MLSAADLQTLSNATLKLYAPGLHANNWVEHAFTFIHSIVDADMVNFGDLDPKTGDLVATTTCDRGNWHGAVVGFGQFMKLHPFFCFDPNVNAGKPFFRSDFITAREFRDLAIYSECFRILETMDHAAVYVPTGDGHLAWFAAERGGCRNFTEHDRLMLTLGQQHLVNSHKLALARTFIRDEFPLDAAIFVRAGFTPRESDVAYWLTEGKSNQEIAELMKIHLQTVKAHVSELLNKTGTSNRLALTLHLIDRARALACASNALQHVTVRSVEHLAGFRR